MRTLALDPTTRDLLLTGGRLTLVEGAAAVAHRLAGRLSLWQGDWFADTSLGVPFLTFLGVKGAAALAEASLRRAILSCPGVAALETLTFAAQSDRTATLTFRARTASGEILPGFEDGGFRVGG